MMRIRSAPSSVASSARSRSVTRLRRLPSLVSESVIACRWMRSSMRPFSRNVSPARAITTSSVSTASATASGLMLHARGRRRARRWPMRPASAGTTSQRTARFQVSLAADRGRFPGRPRDQEHRGRPEDVKQPTGGVCVGRRLETRERSPPPRLPQTRAPGIATYGPGRKRASANTNITSETSSMSPIGYARFVITVASRARRLREHHLDEDCRADRREPRAPQSRRRARGYLLKSPMWRRMSKQQADVAERVEGEVERHLRSTETADRCRTRTRR